MIAMIFFLSALGLFGLGGLLMRNTSAFTTSGGESYDSRRLRRQIGRVLLIAGVMPLGIAAVAEFYSNDGAAIYYAPRSSSAGEAITATNSLTPSLANSNNTVAMQPPPTNNSASQPEITQVADLLQEANQSLGQKQLDDALGKVNAALDLEPQNPDAYALRGNVYAAKQLWIRAEDDYQTALQINGKDKSIKFDLGEVEFILKKYDAARTGFAALEQDPDFGDLAGYKAFLCDLFGGHEDVAAKELDAFNQVGSNPSYYFANATWCLYHQKPEDAQGWLNSAAHIYAPSKFKTYASCLIELGYGGSLSELSSTRLEP
jgi:tetratricopeptide (TPR) repeat protein